MRRIRKKTCKLRFSCYIILNASFFAWKVPLSCHCWVFWSRFPDCSHISSSPSKQCCWREVSHSRRNPCWTCYSWTGTTVPLEETDGPVHHANCLLIQRLKRFIYINSRRFIRRPRSVIWDFAESEGPVNCNKESVTAAKFFKFCVSCGFRDQSIKTLKLLELQSPWPIFKDLDQILKIADKNPRIAV